MAFLCWSAIWQFKWTELPWLLLLDHEFSDYYVMPSQNLDRRAFLLTMLGLAEFAGLLMVVLAAQRYAPSSIRRSRLWQSVRVAGYTAVGGGLGLVYVQMLWVAPFPPPLVAVNNHYERILQITEQVQRLNETSLATADLEPFDPEAAEQLRGIYRELIGLLDWPNALPDDLPAADWQGLHARTSVERFHLWRTLGR
jgi:hypothetical protein